MGQNAGYFDKANQRYSAFFLCACERSFETTSFSLNYFGCFQVADHKMLSIFSKSKRPFEKQTTPRLVTYLGLSMDKIWAKMIFWLWPRNFDFARFLQTFMIQVLTCPILHLLAVHRVIIVYFSK